VAAAAAAGVQGPPPTPGEDASKPEADGIGLQILQPVVPAGQRVERLTVEGCAAAAPAAVAHDRQGYRSG
jgi:hypothetical protein